MRKAQLPDEVIADIKELNFPRHQILNTSNFVSNEGMNSLIPYEYAGGKIAKFLLEDERNYESYCRYILDEYVSMSSKPMKGGERMKQSLIPSIGLEFRKSTADLVDLLLLNLADLIETPTDIEPELVDLYFCVKEFKTKEGL